MNKDIDFSVYLYRNVFVASKIKPPAIESQSKHKRAFMFLISWILHSFGKKTKNKIYMCEMQLIVHNPLTHLLQQMCKHLLPTKITQHWNLQLYSFSSFLRLIDIAQIQWKYLFRLITCSSINHSTLLYHFAPSAYHQPLLGIVYIFSFKKNKQIFECLKYPSGWFKTVFLPEKHECYNQTGTWRHTSQMEYEISAAAKTKRVLTW